MTNTEPSPRSFLDRFRRTTPTAPAPVSEPAPEFAGWLREAAESGAVISLHAESWINQEVAAGRADEMNVATYAEDQIDTLVRTQQGLTNEPAQLISAARIAGEYRAQWAGRDEAVTAAAADLYAAVHATAGSTPDHTLHDIYQDTRTRRDADIAESEAELEAMWDAEQERITAAETDAATTRGTARVDELLLGVPGTGPRAAAERVAAASTIITADYEAYKAENEDVRGEWPYPEYSSAVLIAIAIKDADGNPLDATYHVDYVSSVTEELSYLRDDVAVRNPDGTNVHDPAPEAQRLIDAEIAATRTELQARGFAPSPEQQARLNAADLTADTTHAISASEPDRSAAIVETDRATGQVRTLQQRMEAEYLAGYDARIRTGLAYSAADPDARAAIGDDVLQEKVQTYRELDELTDTFDEELPGMAKFFDPDLADQPLTPAAETALERAAHIAGRWDGIDPVISNQISAIDNQLLEITHAPAVATAGNARDAWFAYSPTNTHAAQQALPLIDRDTTERLARSAGAQTNTVPAPAQAWTSGRITSYPMNIATALSASPAASSVLTYSSTAYGTQKPSLER